MAVANANELKDQAETLILKYLVHKADKAEENWLEETGVDTRYVNNDAPGQVARSLYSEATDEFLGEYPETTEDTLENDVQEYINSNYDSSFMRQQIEHRQSTDDILSEQRDDLVLWITNDSRFSNGNDDSYWNRCAEQVHNVREMQGYLSEDGLVTFAERYAPDYQEHLQ